MTSEDIEKMRGEAEKGDADAQYLLAMHLDEEGDESTAKEWFAKAATQGHLPSQAEIAKFLYNSVEDIADNLKEKVFEYFQNVTENGISDHDIAYCRFCLAECFLTGYGVEKNITKAHSIFKSIAEDGRGSAQLILAGILIIYETNNLKEATHWLKKAATQKEDFICIDGTRSTAQFLLGTRYLHGIGIEKNQKAAFNWFLKAARPDKKEFTFDPDGNLSAKFHLGECYRLGNGITKNEKEALKWFQEAAAEGHAEAQNHVGLCYVNGLGVTKDQKKGAEWILKSANKGNTNAQMNIANSFKIGRGVIKHGVKAYAWYNVACANGLDDACKERDSLESILTKPQLSKAQNLSQELYENIERHG